MGDTGPQGPEGPIGLQGPQGIQGPIGPEGPSGSLDAWALSGATGTDPMVNFLGTADAQPLEIRVNSRLALRIQEDATGPLVGIGTPTPLELLHVGGNFLVEGDMKAAGIKSEWVTINATAAKPGYALSVDGRIVCEELLVQNSIDWPDYVFRETYILKPLQEVEAHIKAKGRLPGIPSADEVRRDGLPVADIQTRMMEKIEELTLYSIEQDKRLAEQDSRIRQLEALIQKEDNL
jgi:hypothetical protein